MLIIFSICSRLLLVSFLLVLMVSVLKLVMLQFKRLFRKDCLIMVRYMLPSVNRMLVHLSLKLRRKCVILSSLFVMVRYLGLRKVLEIGVPLLLLAFIRLLIMPVSLRLVNGNFNLIFMVMSEIWKKILKFIGEVIKLVISIFGAIEISTLV